MDDIFRIPSKLATLWKDFFGLYTQYVGYLTPDMVRTILQTKRGFDSSPEENFTDMSLSQLNEYAQKHGFYELPDMEEIDDVLPLIWNLLKKYDLSDLTVPPEKWKELMEFLDFCKTKKRLFMKWSN